MSKHPVRIRLPQLQPHGSKTTRPWVFSCVDGEIEPLIPRFTEGLRRWLGGGSLSLPTSRGARSIHTPDARAKQSSAKLSKAKQSSAQLSSAQLAALRQPYRFEYRDKPAFSIQIPGEFSRGKPTGGSVLHAKKAFNTLSITISQAEDPEQAAKQYVETL